MKRTLPLFFLLFMCVINFSFAQTVKKTNNKKQIKEIPFHPDSLKGCVLCLQINGKIDLGKDKTGFDVEIYRNDSLVSTINAEASSGKFKVFLPFNNKFKVLLRKEGYYKKFIHVDTKFPNKRVENQYELEFITNMFKTLKDLDADILNQPTAEVKYYPQADIFNFDPVYTMGIKEEIKKLYQDYKLLQKIDADFAK